MQAGREAIVQRVVEAVERVTLPGGGNTEPEDWSRALVKQAVTVEYIEAVARADGRAPFEYEREVVTLAAMCIAALEKEKSP